MSGDTVVLHCPIHPGALLQQYSVKWKKYAIIAEAINPQSVMTVNDSHYKIDRGTYSLIIDPVNTNDTSTNYQCELSVTNPRTNVPQVLQTSPPVTISLKVFSKYSMLNTIALSSVTHC